MARLFDDGSNENAAGAAPVTAAPFTVAGWCFPDDVSTIASPWSLSNNTVTTMQWAIRLLGTTAGDPMSFACRAGGAFASADTSNGVTVNTWHHVAGVAASATSRTCVLDGDTASAGTNTTSLTPTGINSNDFGRFGDSTPSNHFSGRLAEWAMWSVALSDDEIVSLAKGFSPLMVRSASLVGYWPFMGATSPEVDLRGGNNLTLTGTTKADHCRIIYPSRPRLVLPQAATPPAGGNAPQKFMHYQRMRAA